jgi:hypothetical protein
LRNDRNTQTLGNGEKEAKKEAKKGGKRETRSQHYRKYPLKREAK